MKPRPRVLTACVAALAISSSALGAPGDPFSVALAGRDTEPLEGVEATGAANVSAQQGSVSYSYTIERQPGRNGMSPHLSLAYSSQGATRGGLAVGWTLSLPSIERDTAVASMYRYNGELLVPAPGDVGTPLM